MHIKTTHVRGKDRVYQYAQLVESFRREDGMPSQRVVANLGARTDLEIANLRLALGASRAGRAVVVQGVETTRPTFEIVSNLAYLDVAVVVAVLRRLGVVGLLADLLPRTEADVPDGDVVTALVAQRCVAPASKLAATAWFARTALPELLGLRPERFNNTRLHRVLDGLETSEEALQARLASALWAGKGPFSTLFLDLTDTWFVGDGPALATAGKTKEGLYRRKVGIALLCDQDGFPLRWSVVEGRRHDSGPMKEIAQALQAVDWAKGVPLVLDRAMGATAHIEDLLATDQPFLTALTRTEFDAYTDRVPVAAVADLPWSTPDAASRAGAAAVGAGMTRIRDDLCVLDLGVVTRREPDSEAGPPAVGGNDKCRDRLLAARAIQEALDSGKEKTLKEAAKAQGLRKSLACSMLRLLRLAPDIQASVLAGEATMLSLTDLAALTALADFEAQRSAYDAVRAAAEHHPDARRGRATGRTTAAPPPPPAPPKAVRLRAIVAFNPEHWVRQKETSDRRLAELRAWTRGLNQRLQDPSNRSTPAGIADAARDRLRRYSLVDAFVVRVTTTTREGRPVHQLSVEPDPESWRMRQRFHGFQVLVARPEESRSAEDLVRTYRAKDAVEKDFQTMKSVLHLRPVRHRTDAKVRAHVTLCMLALLVERAMEQAMKGRMTAPAAFEHLQDVHLNRLRTSADSLPVYALTRPGPTHLELLDALGLRALVHDIEVTASIHPR